MQYFFVFAQRHTQAQAERPPVGTPAAWSLAAAPHCLACITSENTGWRDAQHVPSISINTASASWGRRTAQQCGAVLCHVVLRCSCTTCSCNLATLKGAKRPPYEAAGESVSRGLAATETLRSPRETREAEGRHEPPRHCGAFNDLMGNGDDLNDRASAHICRLALCTKYVQGVNSSFTRKKCPHQSNHEMHTQTQKNDIGLYKTLYIIYCSIFLKCCKK